MIAILTADLINSAAYETAVWMEVLKTTLSKWGRTPEDWEIYRGDELQMRTDPENALQTALELKARIKCIKDLDIRIGIGLGEEDFKGDGISESNGSAYQRSGRVLDELKLKKKNLGIDTGITEQNRSLNLVLALASDFMDSWSTVSAEMIALSLSKPGITQKDMANELNIQQSAISQRQKRARWSLVQDVIQYYKQVIEKIES